LKNLTVFFFSFLFFRIKLAEKTLFFSNSKGHNQTGSKKQNPKIKVQPKEKKR